MSRKPPPTTEPPTRTVFHMILFISACRKGCSRRRKICNKDVPLLQWSYLDMYPLECRDLLNIRRRILDWPTGKPCYTITEIQCQHSLFLLDSNRIRIDCIVAIPRSLCEISCRTPFLPHIPPISHLRQSLYRPQHGCSISCCHHWHELSLSRRQLPRRTRATPSEWRF